MNQAMRESSLRGSLRVEHQGPYPDRRRGAHLARLLAPIAEVRAHESITVLAMAAHGFLLFAVHYLLKPLREAWILPAGADTKAYIAAIQAMVLIGVSAIYARLARHLRRDRLVIATITTAIITLVAFDIVRRSGFDTAWAFFLWLGVMNLLSVAQFWSFATDIFGLEQGRRLFALLGLGSALGAAAGAQLARTLLVAGESELIWVSAVLLSVVPLLVSFVHRRESSFRRREDLVAPRSDSPRPQTPVARSRSPGVFCDPYLRALAAFTLLLNAASLLGEYTLDRALLDEIHDPTQLGAFKADYYASINVIVLFVQLFVVSRAIRSLGERYALAVVPALIAVGSALALSASSLALPLLTLLAGQRALENGLAHSIQSTARQTLFLVAPRDARWSSKAFIDTVTWRAGDVVGASLVAGLSALDATLDGAIIALLGVGLIWMSVWWSLAVEHRRLELELKNRADGVASHRPLALADESSRSPASELACRAKAGLEIE